MPRKAVLSGGKRDQIIDVAMALFFEHGYEATSVRMIMDAVGGEIGMFYHYFPSKDALFDQVVERFFQGFGEKFEAVLSQCEKPEEFADAFLPLYGESMAQYRQLEGRMHWSIRYALHAMTIDAQVSAVASHLEKIGVESDVPFDILARQLVHGASATLHSAVFEAMSPSEQHECLSSFVNAVLYGQVPSTTSAT